MRHGMLNCLKTEIPQSASSHLCGLCWCLLELGPTFTGSLDASPRDGLLRMCKLKISHQLFFHCSNESRRKHTPELFLVLFFPTAAVHSDHCYIGPCHCRRRCFRPPPPSTLFSVSSSAVRRRRSPVFSFLSQRWRRRRLRRRGTSGGVEFPTLLLMLPVVAEVF